MKVAAKGATYKECLFLSKVVKGELIVAKDGTVFNPKTNRYMGDRENPDLYPNISIRDVDQKTYTLSRHVLVWLVFKGDIPEGFEINHKDGNKHNTELINLELITNSGNKQHAVQMGLWNPAYGERGRNAKFKNEDVVYYRHMVNVIHKHDLETRLEWIDYISAKHKVRLQNVREILSGKKYARVAGVVDTIPLKIIIDEKTIKRINLEYKKHRNYRTVAKLLDLSRSTVDKYVDDKTKAEYPLAKGGMTKEVEKQLKRQFAIHKTVGGVAKAMNMDYHAVRSRLNKLGLIRVATVLIKREGKK